MVEMLELRSILQRCDSHSLVLGDELCSGTESVSALAIVAAGIKTLVSKKTTFVFATHLHDLSTIDLPKAVDIAHMHTEVTSDGNIVFDRTLRPGVGSSVYGLEVCHGLGMPEEFLRLAHEIRCKVQGIAPDIVNPQVSRYNSKVFKDTCKVCNGPATEVHHMRQQCDADSEGFIEHVYKNRVSNLLPLCESCHQDIHKNNETVKYIQTVKGKKVARKKAAVAAIHDP